MIEMRWFVPQYIRTINFNKSTAHKVYGDPVLQYRIEYVGEDSGVGWSEWMKIPTVYGGSENDD